jgi:hypothetical protein
MPNAMTDMLELGNLYRAWRWLRSNPDAAFKSYFRNIYGIYAVAEDRLLKDMQRRLRRGIYEPTHACKLFLPKPSGVLRPYSLLGVEDQLAYQAAANVIAERLFPKVRHRYNKEVFGHLYAGKTSTWFYRKWSDGYKRFNDAARQAFSDGYRIAASFDLTACYDSLDHGVLQHFLRTIGCEVEFCEMMCRWLNVWTATDQQIYHNHGIPQGPLASGLLSEVVLQHFDASRGRQRSVRYFRYVDDIRLFAKNERDIRRMLIRLDLLSKDVGLFPQSSKISIHEVRNIEDELKSVSRPTEVAVKRRTVDQERLRKRIVQLTPQFEVTDSTRFKYLLAHAEPNATMTERLWRIHENAPHMYGPFSRYLLRYKKMPRKAAERLLKEVRKESMYPSVPASFIDAAWGRLSEKHESELLNVLKGKWKPNSLQPDLLVAYGRCLLKSGRLTFSQSRYACRRTRSWWGRTQLTFALTDKYIGVQSLEGLVADALCDESGDVALAAAHVAVDSQLAVTAPRNRIHPIAAEVLKEFGLIGQSRSRICGIDASLQKIVGGQLPRVKWRVLLGRYYRHAERQIVRCKGLAQTDASAFVNAMDVFNDFLLESIYQNDGALGLRQLGNFGVLSSPKLKRKYPKLFALIHGIHEKRYQSDLSHARQKRTGRPTQVIRFSFLRTARRLIRDAVVEAAAMWPR